MQTQYQYQAILIFPTKNMHIILFAIGMDWSLSDSCHVDYQSIKASSLSPIYWETTTEKNNVLAI